MTNPKKDRPKPPEALLIEIHAAIVKVPEFQSPFWDTQPKLSYRQWQMYRAERVYDAVLDYLEQHPPQ